MGKTAVEKQALKAELMEALEKAVISAEDKLSFEERVSAYVLLKEFLFWSAVKAKAEERLKVILQSIPAEVLDAFEKAEKKGSL